MKNVLLLSILLATVIIVVGLVYLFMFTDIDDETKNDASYYSVDLLVFIKSSNLERFLENVIEIQNVKMSAGMTCCLQVDDDTMLGGLYICTAKKTLVRIGIFETDQVYYIKYGDFKNINYCSEI